MRLSLLCVAALCSPAAGFTASVASTTRAPAAPSRRKAGRLTMNSIMPVVSAAEAGAAAFAGHTPGVVLGIFGFAWSMALKGLVVERAGGLKGVVETFSSVLGAWTMVLLAVRAFTFAPDSRYADGFPSDVAHPAGCTRVAPTLPCRSRAPPPVVKGSVTEVQGSVRSWIENQPRSRIYKDEPGYIHAQFLSLLMGFPDNFGVKLVPKGSETEIWVQSELRVGEGDLGVNAERVAQFIKYLEKSE